MVKAPSFSFSPIINGTSLICFCSMRFFGSSGINGNSLSVSTRGPNAIGIILKTYIKRFTWLGKNVLYSFVLRTSIFFRKIANSLAGLLRRQDNTSLEFEDRQSKSLANNLEYSPTDFSIDQGLSADPDWAIARWNSPFFNPNKQLLKFSFSWESYATECFNTFGMRW